MGNNEASFVYSKTPKIFSEIKELADDGKKDEFKQERMFGRVAKIPISNTFNEQVGMGFAECGDYATFLHIQDTFSRFAVIIFPGAKKKGEQTAEMVKGSAISYRVAIFGTPEILTAGKDSRFIGKFPRDFSPSRNIILQTAIPGHHQSLGSTERRRRLFRSIIDHVVGERKQEILNNKEWVEICRHVHDALKFTSSAVWRFYTGAKSFRANAKITYRNGW